MNNDSTATEAPKQVRSNSFVEFLKRLVSNRVSLIGLIILGIIILAAIFAPLIAPYDPYAMNYSELHATPSLAHIFGTDNLGRDIFSRLLYGARYSLFLGFTCSLASAVFGVVVGSIIGYIGGRFDMVMMRICDILGSIPSMLLAILISTALGQGYFNTILAMTVGGLVNSVRSCRAMALREREMEYLEAAKAMNCSTFKIIFRHMIPNIVSPTIVGTTMMIGNSINQAAALSFIGLGVQEPTPEWGAILSSGREFIMKYPHETLFPGLIIFITVLATNMIGDGLRDALDPKLKD